MSCGISYLPSPTDLISDVALVFDSSWHWKRAGELLGAQLPDLSLKPGLTYMVGLSDVWVHASDGSGWYKSARDYIKYRLGSIASSLPVAEQRRICDMIVKIASADEGLAEEVNIFDYALRASRWVM